MATCSFAIAKISPAWNRLVLSMEFPRCNIIHRGMVPYDKLLVVFRTNFYHQFRASNRPATWELPTKLSFRHVLRKKISLQDVASDVFGQTFASTSPSVVIPTVRQYFPLIWSSIRQRICGFSIDTKIKTNFSSQSGIIIDITHDNLLSFIMHLNFATVAATSTMT